jgi:hypothetical protein
MTPAGVHFDGVDDGMERDDALGLGPSRTVLSVLRLAEPNRRGPPFVLGQRGTTQQTSDFWGRDPATHGARGPSFGVYLISIGIQSASHTALRTHVLVTEDASTSPTAVASSTYHIDGVPQTLTQPGSNVRHPIHAPDATMHGGFPGSRTPRCSLENS